MAKQESKELKKKSSGIAGWLVLAAIGGITYIGATYQRTDAVQVSSVTADEQQASKYQRRCTVKRYGSMAFVMAQSHIKQRLSDPSSAKFGYKPASTSVDSSTCTFTILGEFSAKNGFGGRVRGSYFVKIKRYEDGSWAPVSVSVDE